MIERDLEKYLVREIKSVGAQCLKLAPAYMRGLPDRLVVSFNKVYFVELKRDATKRPTPIQTAVHQSLRLMGQDVRVVHDLNGVHELVDDICRDKINANAY
jgi:hypothetical protein